MALVAQFARLQAESIAQFTACTSLPAGVLTAEAFNSFNRALAVHAQLWQLQQTARQELLLAGLRRSDIGEIAMRIAQLYFTLYLRTGDTRYLQECHTFYQAIHARAYFEDPPVPTPGPLALQQPRQQVLLAAGAKGSPAPNQLALQPYKGLQTEGSGATPLVQFRFYARYIITCLMAARKEEACGLLQEFQALISAHALGPALGGGGSRVPGLSPQDWLRVCEEISGFLTADVGMPLPRSPGATIAFKPCLRACSDGPEASAGGPHQPRISHAVIVSYCHKQVKIAEYPIDMVRMMQSLEWSDDGLLGTAGSGADGVSVGTGGVTSAPIPLSAAGRAGSLALPMRAPETHTGLGPSPLATGPGGLESYSDGSRTNGSQVNGDSPESGPGALSATAAALAAAEGVSKMQLGSSGSESSSHRPTGMLGTSTSTVRNPPRTLLFRTTAPVLLNVLHTLMASSPVASTASGGLASSSDSGGLHSALGSASGTSGAGEEGVLLLYLGVSSLQARLKAAQVKASLTATSSSSVLTSLLSTGLPSHAQQQQQQQQQRQTRSMGRPNGTAAAAQPPSTAAASGGGGTPPGAAGATGSPAATTPPTQAALHSYPVSTGVALSSVDDDRGQMPIALAGSPPARPVAPQGDEPEQHSTSAGEVAAARAGLSITGAAAAAAGGGVSVTLPLPCQTPQQQQERVLQQGASKDKGVSAADASPGVVSPEQQARSAVAGGLTAAVAGAAVQSALQAPTPSASLLRALCLSPPPALLQAVAPLTPTDTAAVATSRGSSEVVLLPEDLVPLTRRRLLVVCDGDAAGELSRLSGLGLVHPPAAILSPAHRPSAFGEACVTGSLLTLFLTAPLSGMCLIIGERDVSCQQLMALQDALDMSLSDIARALGLALQQSSGRTPAAGHPVGSSGSSGTPFSSASYAQLHMMRAYGQGAGQAQGGDEAGSTSTWALAFQDVMLRSIICRFVLMRAAMAGHRASAGRPECQPSCFPALPPEVDPSSSLCMSAVRRVAAVCRKEGLFSW